MAVLMVNASLGLRRRADGTGEDALGDRVGRTLGPLLGPLPGRTREETGGTWALALDPSLWPVRQDDVVEADDGHQWSVRACQLLRNNVDSSVDYIRVEASEIKPGGSEPGGPQFVGR